VACWQEDASAQVESDKKNENSRRAEEHEHSEKKIEKACILERKGLGGCRSNLDSGVSLLGRGNRFHSVSAFAYRGVFRVHLSFCAGCIICVQHVCLRQHRCCTYVFLSNSSDLSYLFLHDAYECALRFGLFETLIVIGLKLTIIEFALNKRSAIAVK